MYLQFHIPCRERESEQDQIELEKSASCQWETGKGDIVVGSMSGRGCMAWGRGKMELKKKEWERILILDPDPERLRELRV